MEQNEVPEGDGSNEIRELRDKFIELEYEYLSQSGFHSDNLRNQIIQFYLIIAGAGGSIVVALPELRNGAGAPPPGQGEMSTWAYSLVAAFIGLIGVLMLPIFARLRRVAIECMAGTVLLKQYVVRTVGREGIPPFDSSLVWDSHSLNTDEDYLRASFLLIFVVMVLDSALFAIAAFFAPWFSNPSDLANGLWSATIGMGLLTLQVAGYRTYLWNELRKVASDRLREKWGHLMGERDDELKGPVLLGPLLLALGLGGAATGLLAYAAWYVSCRPPGA